MDSGSRGVVLVAVGVLLLAGTLTIGAATAPDRSVGDGEQRATLVGSQGGGPGWHEKGSVYRLEGDAMPWREDSADSYFDVERLDDGTVLAGFMDSGYEAGCAPYDPPCTKTGFRVIDPAADGGPTVTGEYAFPVRTEKNSEIHAASRLENGEFLLVDMEQERVFTVDPGDQRIPGDDSEITWQWNASSFYDAPPDPTRRDWLHTNDVDAINETHFLVSVRNANQVLVVERGEGVVEVINADTDDSDDDACKVRGEQLEDFDGDGDIRCGDPAVLNHQHNPQWLDSGAVLVADSDNDRVVELHRENGSWEPAWTLTRAGGSELHWPRDADRLDNGNTLVTDTLNKRVIEVTPNGTVVWSRETPTDSPIPYEADRLPESERAGAERYAADGQTEAASGGVPGLSLLLVGVQAAAPWTPFWFSEGHLAVSLLAVLLVGGGSVDWYRTRR